MKQLLLLLTLALVPSVASAQFSFDRAYPDNTDEQFRATHGLATDALGRIWVQPYYTTTNVSVNGTDTATRALYVYNADGTAAPCSPVLFIKDAAGVKTDTLGIFITSAGTRDTRTGRGLRADIDGDILASYYDTMFKIDHASCSAADNAVTSSGRVTPVPTASLATPATDDAGNIYLATVVPGNPIFSYDASLNNLGNVVEASYGFNRSIMASEDGLALFDLSYSSPYIVVHARAGEFDAWQDSVGVTGVGLRAESAAIQPATDYYWFSSGPTASGGPNEYQPIETFYAPDTWYAFRLEDMVTIDNGTITVNPNPTAVDSIAYVNPPAPAGPRAITFSLDGNTAYVGHFGANPGPAVQVFIRNPIAVEGEPSWKQVLTLDQNQPNPVADQTTIKFSTFSDGHVRIRVFDTAGRQVATATDQAYTAGDHSVKLDASGLAAGVYVYAIDVNGVGTSRQMVVVR